MARRKADQPKPTPHGDHWSEPAVQEAIKRGAPQLRERLDSYDHDQHMRQFFSAFDEYANPLTGIGDPYQDKTYGGSPLGLEFFVQYIPAIAAENRWRGSDLGGTIVEKIPEEMTREGFDVIVMPDEDDDPDDEAARADFAPPDNSGESVTGAPATPTTPKVAAIPEIDTEATDTSEALEGALDDLGMHQAFYEALCYERAYGGGAVLIGADDGEKDLTKPLNEKNIKSIGWLNSLTGGRDGEIVAWSYYRDPSSAKYGQPEVYMVRNIGVPSTANPAPGTTVVAPDVATSGSKYGFGQLVFWVHESRLLIFGGTPVSRRALVQMRGWGDSIFTRVDRVLQQFGQTWGAIANVMTDFRLDVLQVDGLAMKMAGNGGGAVSGVPATGVPIAGTIGGGPPTKAFVARAKAIQLTKSISRMLIIDKTEGFQRAMSSLGGIAEVLQQFGLRLAAAADMPVEIIFGQAPAGLSATGDSTIRFFYDRVAAKQRRRMLPQVKRLVRLLMLSKTGPTKGVEIAKWDVVFRSLYQMTEQEKVDLRNKQAQTDQIYINTGVTSPAEITASRFGGAEYSTDTALDLDGREEQADKDEEERNARMKAMSTAMQNPASVGKAGPAVKDPNPTAPPTASRTSPPTPITSADAWAEEEAKRQMSGKFGAPEDIKSVTAQHHVEMAKSLRGEARKLEALGFPEAADRLHETAAEHAKKARAALRSEAPPMPIPATLPDPQPAPLMADAEWNEEDHPRGKGGEFGEGGGGWTEHSNENPGYTHSSSKSASFGVQDPKGREMGAHANVTAWKEGAGPGNAKGAAGVRSTVSETRNGESHGATKSTFHSSVAEAQAHAEATIGKMAEKRTLEANATKYARKK